MSGPESVVERKIVNFLKRRFYWPIKISLCSENGFPDRLVIGHRCFFFIEVKQPGKKADPLQRHVHRKLAAFGVDVIVADNVEMVKEYVDNRKDRMHISKFKLKK